MAMNQNAIISWIIEVLEKELNATSPKISVIKQQAGEYYLVGFFNPNDDYPYANFKFYPSDDMLDALKTRLKHLFIMHYSEDKRDAFAMEFSWP